MASRAAWVGLVVLALGTAACGDDAAEAGPGDAIGDVDPGEDGGGDVGEQPDADKGDQDAVGGEDGEDGGGDSGPAPECPAPDGERPSRVSEHAGVYDAARDRVVVFGGSFAVPENCGFPTPTFETETWIYDVACDHWRVVDQAGGPQGRARHAAAYDSQRGRMIVFGGRWRAGASGNYTLLGDTWAFDLATETWSELPTTSGPAARVNHAMVYDPQGDRVLVFGGNTSASGLAITAKMDVWALELATGTWTEIATASGPAPRLWHTAVWDPARHRMVVYGGGDETAFNNTAKYFDDLWALEVSGTQGTWTRLDTGSATRPAGRFWAGLVYDADGDRYVLFGGHDDGNLGNRNDLHAFDPEAGGWATLRVADTWNKPATGFCAFPPDFTNVDMDSPERRNAHVFVGGEAGRAFAMGGKTDCGVTDDLMALELETATWTELTTATVGVSCLRRGGLSCNDLCL